MEALSVGLAIFGVRLKDAAAIVEREIRLSFSSWATGIGRGFWRDVAPAAASLFGEARPRRFTPLEPRVSSPVSSNFDWETCHRVEKDFYSVAEFLPLPEPIPPLRFERERARHWLPAAELSRFCRGADREAAGVRALARARAGRKWVAGCWSGFGRGGDRFGPAGFGSGGRALAAGAAGAARPGHGGQGGLAANGGVALPGAALCRTRYRDDAPGRGVPLSRGRAFRPDFIEDHWHPWQSPYRIVTSRGYVAGQRCGGAIWPA